MKKIKFVIFDFDGTIANTLPYTFDKLSKLLKREKINTTEKQLLKNVRTRNFHELMKEWKISWLKLPFILREIKQIQNELYLQIDKIKVFPGMETLLKELKKQGYILAILSSNLEKNVKKFLLVNNLEMFEHVDCGSQILGKAEAINNFLKKNKLVKEECIYVGDEIRDAEACKKARIKMIGVSWGLNTSEILKKNGVDYIAQKPSEILQLINS